MKYNGIELTNMTPESWDGKTREMLVWNDCDPKPRLALVCGFSRKGHPIADIGNYKKELAHSNHVLFQYCAEIPKEEPNQEQNVDEMIKVLNAYKEGKTIERRFKARKMREDWVRISKPPLDWTLYEYRIANDQQTKKTRRMTNRELKEWCAEGKGLFKNDYTNAAYTVFGYNVNRDEMNAPVGNWIHIRAWNETEWHEPLIEE